MCVTACILWT